LCELRSKRGDSTYCSLHINLFFPPLRLRVSVLPLCLKNPIPLDQKSGDFLECLKYSDTNILIDMEDGNLTPVIFRLPYEIAVPDILFELELRERHSYLLEAGLKVKSLSAESAKKTEFLTQQYPRLYCNTPKPLALCNEIV